MKKIQFSKLQIKQDMDKIIVLHIAHISFLFLALFIELITYEDTLASLLKILFCVVGSILFHRVMKNLYYTFWTFSIIALVFYIVNLFSSFSGEGTYSIMNCYLFSTVLLIIEMYLLYSPIFYPVVSWWEYDFRYRHDLRIEVTKSKKEKEEDKKIVGRLTDVRRYAGCIQLFEDLQTSDKVQMKVFLDDGVVKTLSGEIISKRQYSIGRPWSYGIKMSFESQEEEQAYKDLEFSWKSDRRDKISKKFEKNDDLKESSRDNSKDE